MVDMVGMFPTLSSPIRRRKDRKERGFLFRCEDAN